MVNTSGCGDSLVGATVWAMCVRGLTAREAVKFGLAAARFTLESPLSVSPLISPARLEAAVAAAQEWR
jgi:sugar/nucleoside kinase (ribokinase family)